MIVDQAYIIYLSAFAFAGFYRVLVGVLRSLFG